MPLLSSTQIQKTTDPGVFELQCAVLFEGILEDPNVKPYGTSGQAQQGVDLFGRRKDLAPDHWVGIQCKLTAADKLPKATVRDEATKALKFRPALREYVIVTTADDDAALDEEARLFTAEQAAAGRAFEVQVWGWRTLKARILEDQRAIDAFAPDASPRIDAIADGVKRLQNQLQSTLGMPLVTGRSDVAALRWRFRDRPTELLIARYRAVPFLDRAGLLEGLLHWAEDRSARRAQGRLHVAPGGFGKTRLGIELVAALEERGWRCSFVSPANAQGLAPGAFHDLLRGEGTAGLCVVVDYAEGQTGRLRDLANAAANIVGDGPPIRLVAFARSAAGWWDALSREAGPAEVFDPTPIAAVGDVLTLEERQELFTCASDAFDGQLRALGRRRTRAGTPSIETGADRPLSVLAAAFLAARGIDRSAETPFETLYREERRHWRRMLGVDDDDAPEVEDLARAAAQVTLVQGASEDGVRALINADPSERVLGPPRLLPALRRLYGRDGVSSEQGGRLDRSGFIGPIEPDFLGEHAALRVLEHGAGRLIVPTMRAALRGPPLSAEDPRAILTVLTRATRPEHDRTVVRTAERTVARLADEVPLLEPDHIERLEAALPLASVALQELAAAVAHRLVELAPTAQSVEALTHRARTLNNLGVRLSHLGRFEEALAASIGAVDLRRELVGRDRSTFLPDLALSLDNLGTFLLDLGRRQGALAASAEAVELYRELVGGGRDDLLPDLARSLNNFAIGLARLRRHKEAQVSGAEAVTLYRELVGRDRGAFLPDLAASLTNLGVFLSDLGRHEDALEASIEAVKIRRELAEHNRDAFLPDLALSLTNLGISFSNLDRHEEALAASDQATEHYRALGKRNRDAFLGLLTKSLYSLGLRLSDLGRSQEALAAIVEAVKFGRELVDRSREAFLPDLASMLHQLSVRLARLSRRGEALAAGAEAVELHRELVTRDRDAFLPDLALSLHNLGMFLSDLGRHEDALAAGAEAVEVRRELAGHSADALLADLALSLTNIRRDLSDLDRHAEALAALTEAVEIRRELVRRDRDRFLPDLASSLDQLGIRLEKLGGHEEARAVGVEEVAIRRELVGRGGDAFRADLARSLDNLGGNLSKLGRREEALAAGSEAGRIHRELVERSRNAFLPGLAGSLCNLSAFLSHIGHWDESLAASAEAVELHRELAGRSRDASLPGLAQSFGMRGQILMAVERPDEAAAAFLEGAVTLGSLPDGAPHAFGNLFRRLLRDYVEAARQAGLPNEQMHAAFEALGVGLGDLEEPPGSSGALTGPNSEPER